MKRSPEKEGHDKIKKTTTKTKSSKKKTKAKLSKRQKCKVYKHKDSSFITEAYSMARSVGTGFNVKKFATTKMAFSSSATLSGQKLSGLVTWDAECGRLCRSR